MMQRQVVHGAQQQQRVQLRTRTPFCMISITALEASPIVSNEQAARPRTTTSDADLGMQRQPERCRMNLDAHATAVACGMFCRRSVTSVTTPKVPATAQHSVGE
jgi:hypothetical protein